MFKVKTLSPLARTGLIVGVLTAALLGLVGKHYYQHSRAVPIVLQTAPVDPRSLFQGDYVTLSYDISRLPVTLFDRTGREDDQYLVRKGGPVYVALKDAGQIWVDLYASFEPFADLKADEKQETRLLQKDRSWQLRQLFEWNSEQASRLSGFVYKDGIAKNVEQPTGTPYYVLQRKIGPVWQPVRASTRPLTAQAGEVVLRGNAQGTLRRDETADLRVTYGIEAFFVPEGEGKWVDHMVWTRQRERILVRVLVSPDGTGYTGNILLDGKDAFKSSGLEKGSR